MPPIWPTVATPAICRTVSSLSDLVEALPTSAGAAMADLKEAAATRAMKLILEKLNMFCSKE
jgi:hypothetical protein